MTSTNPSDPNPDVENDAVIGAALQKSLVVFCVLCLPLIAVLAYLNANIETIESVESEVTLPEVREVGETPIPLLTMTEVSQRSGVVFTHQSGRYGQRLLPETMGSGVAVLDYNNDGNQDLLLVNSCYWPWDERHDQPSPCQLLAGDGTFQFKDVSKDSGLDITLYGMGAAVGDYDNDGDCDVFVSAVGKNRMFRNDAGVFTDVTDESGVSGDESSWSTSSGFFDYNNDGLLDLFVANYVTWSKEDDLSQEFTLDGENRAYGPPRAFAGSFSYLYKNKGDGTFEDVSETAGIQVRNDNTDVPLGKAMGLAPVDINRDGWMDILVANDTVRNFLFENNKDGTFSEVGRLSGIAFDRSTGNARGAMGIDSAAFRADGTLAIGIGNFANEASALYMARRGRNQSGRNQFIDAAMFTGFGPPTRKGLTFGLFFFDVDLDGRLDVLGANGHLEEDIAKTQSSQRYEQSPQLFWNAGRDAKSELVLVDKSNVGDSFYEPIVGRGAAYGDFDNDGDQDIVISTSHSNPSVFRNDQTTEHHYVRILLQGTECNRDAIGATVTMKVGDRTLARTVMPTRSYLSQCEKVLTFGLADAEQVDEVTVQWPGGEPEGFQIKTVDQLETLVQGTGSVD